MIRVSLSVLVFVYLFLFLAGVFLTWLFSGIRRKRREAMALRNRLRCSLCAFEFKDESNTPLPRCPRCGSLNERDQFRTL